MKRIITLVTIAVFLFLLASGVVGNAVEFFAWLFFLNYSKPELSIVGEIIVKTLSFLVSFGLVGLIFDSLGLYNAKAMKLVYLIVSTLVGLVLTYIFWTIKQYILVINIILGIILLLTISGIVLVKVFRKRKAKQKTNNDQD